MFIHILGYVRHVQVGVVVVSELLELGVERFLEWSVDVKRRQDEEETHPGEADFVAKIVEATDAVLGILKVVILDKSEADWLAGAVWMANSQYSPLAEIGFEIDDGLGALDVTEALAPSVQHIVGSFGQQTADVDVRFTGLVFETPIKGLVR
jgi:hypothetical protein